MEVGHDFVPDDSVSIRRDGWICHMTVRRRGRAMSVDL
jgi:hypothetical protein